MNENNYREWAFAFETPQQYFEIHPSKWYEYFLETKSPEGAAMKFASVENNTRDGQLILVSRDGKRGVNTSDIAPNLQTLLENWDKNQEQLQLLYNNLNEGTEPMAFDVDESKLLSCLPRGFCFLDGSAYIQHIILVRKARGAEPPETLRTVPLMYQGESGRYLNPTEDIPFQNPDYGLDFEGEVGVIVDDVPMGVSASEATKHIKLLVLINDVSLRGLIPEELGRGFGFLQGKPPSALSPFALTPDELGNEFRGGRIHLPLLSEYKGEFFGNPDAGDMHFSFGELIEHAARTRPLQAGTIIGSGTVSNQDLARGSSCLAEKRMLEKVHDGSIKTPFMQPGDTIKLSMKDKEGHDLFGTIFQTVKAID